MRGALRTPANISPRVALLTRSLGALALLFCSGAAVTTSTEAFVEQPVDRLELIPNIPPPGVRLFDLHDPGLMSTWPGFVATTPMQNDEMLPASLQNRLMHVVATYRSLTPIDRPAFFVATYFDVLSERLLSVEPDEESGIFPMQVCPVFASGNDTSVGSLLAVASGLPDELFVHAPGQPERYRYLFLQTEFSHCRFLATVQALKGPRLPEQAARSGDTGVATLSFDVGLRTYTAMLGSKEELRALVETVGEVDAVSMFSQQMPGGSARNEVEVLRFIRLLSLLATDGKSGYAAIPVLFPLLSEDNIISKESLRISDALDLAYQVREAFRKIVPYPIRDTDELLSAKLTVTNALAAGGDFHAADERISSLLNQFVDGSDLLLTATAAQ